MQPVPNHGREERVQDEKRGEEHISKMWPRWLELRPGHVVCTVAVRLRVWAWFRFVKSL
jgi:hypothetical protein